MVSAGTVCVVSKRWQQQESGGTRRRLASAGTVCVVSKRWQQQESGGTRRRLAAPMKLELGSGEVVSMWRLENESDEQAAVSTWW